MAYKIAYRSSFSRDFKKLQLPVQDFILTLADSIQNGTLKGELKCMFDDVEHTFEELQNCDGLIEFVLIKTREEMNNLYDQSKKYVKKLTR